MENQSELNETEFYEMKLIFYLNENYYTRKNYNLFIKNIIYEPDEKDPGNDYFCLGHYYALNYNYKLMIHYLLLAIEKDNVDAMCDLGHYNIMFPYTNGDFEPAKKYLLMAIDRKNTTAMYFLGEYYYSIEKKYELTDQYFNMIILLLDTEKKDTEKTKTKINDTVLALMGYYYQFIKKDYNLMKKCYLNVIEKGKGLSTSCALSGLSLYYENNENNYELSGYYAMLYLMYYFDYNIPNKYGEFPAKNNYKLESSIVNNICKIYCLNKFEGYKIINVNFKPLNYVFDYLYKTIKKTNDNISEDINNFLICTGRIIYGKENENEKEIINKIIDEHKMEIIDENNSRTKLKIDFRGLLKIKYCNYLDKKYKPGGIGYLKAEKDFEERQHKK
jgi:hypothetical protein